MLYANLYCFILFFITIPGILFTNNVHAFQISPANKIGVYLDKEPFIHPNIIQDLHSRLSDGQSDQVVSINITESIDSNRYYSENISVNTSADVEFPYVFIHSETDHGSYTTYETFGYRLAGITDSDIYVLFTQENSGGSGWFRNLLFVTFEEDYGLSLNSEENNLSLSRERYLIKKLGEIPLGDRYTGKISVIGSEIHIGKDQYIYSAGLFPEDTVLHIEMSF